MPSFHGFLTMQPSEWNLGSSGLTQDWLLDPTPVTWKPWASWLQKGFSCAPRLSCYKYVNLEDFKTLQIPRFLNSKDCGISIAWTPVWLSPGKAQGMYLAKDFAFSLPCICGKRRKGKEEGGGCPTVQIHLVVVDSCHGCLHGLTRVSMSAVVVGFPGIPFRQRCALEVLWIFFF